MKYNYIQNGCILLNLINLNQLKRIEKEYFMIFNFGIEEIFFQSKILLNKSFDL